MAARRFAKLLILLGAPYGTRTRVTAVKVGLSAFWWTSVDADKLSDFNCLVHRSAL
jgi:hypothetical protein